MMGQEMMGCIGFAGGWPLRICCRYMVGGGVLMAALALSGCVTVKAPEKPIVIELNVNIRQEVIYRLAQDADKTIEQNKDIF